jgi:hypothetical protein
MGMLEDLEALEGPFVEWAMQSAGPGDTSFADLPQGHPGVIEGRSELHLEVRWIGHEKDDVTRNAVYDASNVREIDVFTFAERVLALKGATGC